MKFTFSWLTDHLETAASLDEIAARLTALGLEVDSVENRAAELAAFKTARIVKADKHPGADRLKVCVVDTGAETVQVVCGAPNARAGMIGVFAPTGTYIPGIGIELKKAKIRGVESNGMLVSEREMGLSDEHEGIIELAEDVAVGEPFAGILGLDDPVIDIELTPNRPDCTGVRGIARDLAAAGLGTLKPPARAAPVAGTYESPIDWRIADDGNACPYVVGRHFRGVTNGPSPRWMQQRLRAIGLRPISALVDVTDYVSIDLGRPLHVFDAATLTGNALDMQRAKDGQPFRALTGKDYVLDAEMTIIADGDAAHGIGGVMGGATSMCTEGTTEVFLEVALFDPVQVAATGRRLNLQSDARYRFERGVDPVSADWGAEVAARLIMELCGGETSKPVRAGTLPDTGRTITLRTERVRTLGGLEVAAPRQREILTALGYDVPAVENGTVDVAPPTWRPDVHGEADLVEELVRVVGLDQVEAVPLTRPTSLPQPAISPAYRRAVQIKRALAERGLLEAVTWSFMAGRLASHFGGVPPTLHVANPISSDLDVMRPSILPNLIAAAARNVDRGLADPALFELGPQYHDTTPDGQRQVAAGVRQGRSHAAHWAGGAVPVDAIDAKGDAIAGLDAVGAPVANLQITTDAPAWYHPGRSGALRLGAKVLAWFGDIHPRVLQAMDVRGPLVAFELFLDAVPSVKGKARRGKLELSPFQPVARDFAFVVDAKVPADAVLRSVRSADKALIVDVGLFDVYTGPGIDDGKKSLAVAVTLQPRAATLTDQEIDAVAQKVVASVAKHTGGILRG